jgi:hypothetical protein
MRQLIAMACGAGQLAILSFLLLLLHGKTGRLIDDGNYIPYMHAKWRMGK